MIGNVLGVVEGAREMFYDPRMVVEWRKSERGRMLFSRFGREQKAEYAVKL